MNSALPPPTYQCRVCRKAYASSEGAPHGGMCCDQPLEEVPLSPPVAPPALCCDARQSKGRGRGRGRGGHVASASSSSGAAGSTLPAASPSPTYAKVDDPGAAKNTTVKFPQRMLPKMEQARQDDRFPASAIGLVLGKEQKGEARSRHGVKKARRRDVSEAPTLHGSVLYIPDHQSHGEEPYPMGRAATLCDTHELRIIGWIRAVAPTVSNNFVLTGLDVAFQRALQLQEPRAFLALLQGAEVMFCRLKPFYLHVVETGSEADQDWAIVDDAFEPADDVGYTCRGKHGMWKLVVDIGRDPNGSEERLAAALDATLAATVPPPQTEEENRPKIRGPG